MIISIETEKDIVKGIHFDSAEPVTYDDVLAILFCVLENLTADLIEAEKMDDDAKLSLYEHFTAIFEKFLDRLFPDIAPAPFDLSDAAVLYAQDQIIKRAEKKGISFDEALKQYEDKAKAYVENLRRS